MKDQCMHLRLSFLPIIRRPQNETPALCRPAHLIHEECAPALVECKPGLIEQPNLSIDTEESGKAHALAHPCRELSRRARQDLWGESHACSQGLQLLFPACSAARREEEREIFPHRKTRIELHLRCRHREHRAVFRTSHRSTVTDGVNCPRRGEHEPCSNPQQGRFPAPVRPRDRSHSAGMK